MATVGPSGGRGGGLLVCGFGFGCWSSDMIVGPFRQQYVWPEAVSGTVKSLEVALSIRESLMQGFVKCVGVTPIHMRQKSVLIPPFLGCDTTEIEFSVVLG